MENSVFEEKKRPDFLKVLCILTFIGASFGIIGGIIAWAVTKENNSKKARNFLIFGLIWTIIYYLAWYLFITMVILPSFIFPFYPSPKINTVVIKVEYDGEWRGMYQEINWGGIGSKTVTIDRPPTGAIYWVVEALAQKLDDSESVIMVTVTKTDGTVLMQDSELLPYSSAYVSGVID